MSADRNLFKTGWFYLAFFSPIVACFILSSFVWCNSDPPLAFRWDAEGFNFFLKLFKLPLGVLATIVPAVALVTANHRSIQAAANLQAQQSQNNFANYYTHLEQFESFIESRTKDLRQDKFIAKKKLSPRYIHGRMYPKLKEGKFEVSEDLIQEIKQAAQHVAKFTAVVNKYAEMTEDDLSLPKTGIELMEQFLRIDAETVTKTVTSLEEIYLLANGKNIEPRTYLDKTILQVLEISSNLAKVCEFDSDSTSLNLAGHFMGLEIYCRQLTDLAADAKLSLGAPLNSVFNFDETTNQIQRPAASLFGNEIEDS